MVAIREDFDTTFQNMRQILVQSSRLSSESGGGSEAVAHSLKSYPNS